MEQRGAWYLSVIARLKPGVTPQQSAAEVETIGARLARQYPDSDAEIGMATYPLLESMIGEVRRAVLVLLGAVGFVLLIACTNVANLLLARAAVRGSEMAVRTALGANRGRLVRQLLTESVLLSLMGAGLGLLLAVWAVDLLTRLKPEGIPRLENVRVDGTVIAFTILVALVTGVLFGLVPAFSATRGLSSTLKEGGRGAVGARHGSRVRGVLVVAELALAVMLLAGAGLLLRSFMKLQAVDPGFKVDRALTFDLTLPDSRYKEDEGRIAFFDQLLPRLRALPGVRGAAAVMGLPLSGVNFNISFEVKGRPPLAPSQQSSMTLILKSAVPPMSLVEAARTEVYAIDGNLPLSNASTLDAIVAKSISQQRFYMLMLTMFASIALVLAGVGIFGVLSYAVSQRTREIGIRMALGAQGATVIRLIVRQALILVAAGVAAGLLGGLLLSQTMAKMLFDVHPADPVTYAFVSLVLGGVALVASYLPARRATRVDPIVALRAE